jgi:hypothetical protein
MSYPVPYTPSALNGDVSDARSGILLNALNQHIIVPIRQIPNTVGVTFALGEAHSLLKQGRQNRLPPEAQARYLAIEAAMQGQTKQRMLEGFWRFVENYGPTVQQFLLQDRGATGVASYRPIRVEGLTPGAYGAVSFGVLKWVHDCLRKDVLPPAYLFAAVEAVVTDKAEAFRVPLWTIPPEFGAYAQGDETLRASFDAFLKGIGWNAVLHEVLGIASDVWQQQKRAYQQADYILGGVQQTLSYASGQAILRQLQTKVDQLFKRRTEAVALLRGIDALNPKAAGRLRVEMQKTDNQCKQLLSPLGLWQQNAPGLGISAQAVSLALGGMGLAAVALLVAAWIAHIGTAKNVFDSTVADIKDSYARQRALLTAKKAEIQTLLVSRPNDPALLREIDTIDQQLLELETEYRTGIQQAQETVSNSMPEAGGLFDLGIPTTAAVAAGGLLAFLLLK